MNAVKLLKIAKVLLRINAALLTFVLFLAVLYACESAKADESVESFYEIKVMVIDSGIGYHRKLAPYVQYKSEKDENGVDKPTADYTDNHGHGTHIAGIILFGDDFREVFDWRRPSSVNNVESKVCKNVKIYSCKYYDNKEKNFWGRNLYDGSKETTNCIKRATQEGFKVINYSGGGEKFLENEYLAVKEFVEQGGVFIAAAGNNKSDTFTKPFYPASYRVERTINGKKYEAIQHVYPVAALKLSYVRSEQEIPGYSPDKYIPMSNYSQGTIMYDALGEVVYSTLPQNQYGSMSGTSQATAMFLHNTLIETCERIKKQGEE